MDGIESHQEYDQQLTAFLESLWGEGFMSPGGTAEVDLYLKGLDLSGLRVLDIGCGLGGVDIHLVSRHGAAEVVGIDVEQSLINQCDRLAAKHGITDRARFMLVEPGPLPFDEHSFDVVTSKDSIIHIPDKAALASELFRVLRPGGWFAASDWLSGYEGEPSAAMRGYLEAEGLDFGLATARVYRDALETAGFTDITIDDRNAWYREHARTERDTLRTELYEQLTADVGKEFLDHEITVWDRMILALDEGQLRPTHLRGRKPDHTGS